MSNADELQKLKSLLDSGVLTQEEFNIQKKKLLESNNTIQENQNLEGITEKEKVITTIEPSRKIYFKLLFFLPFLYLDVWIWLGISFGLAFIVYPYSIFTNYYEITSNKVIYNFSFWLMGKEIREINRDAIETVQLFQHPTQRFLKIGTILITGKGISSFEIKNIENPETVLKLLENK